MKLSEIINRQPMAVAFGLRRGSGKVVVVEGDGTVGEIAEVTYDPDRISLVSSLGTSTRILSATDTDAGVMAAGDKAKLDGIEDGATGDQSGTEIVSAIDAELGQSDWKTGGGGSGGAATDLSASLTGTTVTVESSDGNDVVLGAATRTDAGIMTAADCTKLEDIEEGATADQTGAEIKALYEGEADTNALTDALLSKLNGIDDGATADQTGTEIIAAIDGEIGTGWQAGSGSGGSATDLSASLTGTTVTIESSDGGDVVLAAATASDAGVMTAADRTKLDGIEDGATADQTAAEIKALYEGEEDTNALTDGLLSKLNSVEDGATADQTGTEIVSAIDVELGQSDWKTGGGGSGNAFSTISVPGQSDVVASGATTLNLLAGSGMTIATNAVGDTITLTAAGGGGGGVALGFVSLADYGPDATGATSSVAAISNADDAADIFVPAGTYLIDADLTIGKRLFFSTGAKLKVLAGVTLKLAAPYHADDRAHIFDIDDDASLAYSASSGTFTVGETVADDVTGAIGTVEADDGSTLTIGWQSVQGVFVGGNGITGQSSGATATAGTYKAPPKVDGLVAPAAGYATPYHFGAVADGVANDRPAIEAAIELGSIQPVNDPVLLLGGHGVKFPIPSNYYLATDRPIVVSRSAHYFGEGVPYGRYNATTRIKAANGLDAVMIAIEGPREAVNYRPDNGPLHPQYPGFGKVGAANRSTFERLFFEPQNASMVRQGFVHNCVLTVVHCRATDFSEVGFHSHGQTSGDNALNITDHPGANNDHAGGNPIAYDGTGSCFGNVNGAVLERCSSAKNRKLPGERGGGSHGFWAHGNNAGTVKYIACDTADNNGVGYGDNTTIGCEYFAPHSSKNTWKVAHKRATSETTLDGALTGGETEVPVVDASGIVAGSYVHVLMDDASFWPAFVQNKAGNTLTISTAAPSAAASGNAVHKSDGYLCIKYDDGTDAAAREPGVGTSWDTYWRLGDTLTTHDDYWEDGIVFHPVCGINVMHGNSYVTVVGGYSEGGIEEGYCVRGSTSVFGSNGAARSFYHPEYATAMVLGGKSNGKSPFVAWSQTDPGDDSTRFGVKLGESEVANFLSFGHSIDPVDTQNAFNAVKLQYIASATGGQSYCWTYSATIRMMAFTIDGWDNFYIDPTDPKLGANLPGGGIRTGGMVYFENGFYLGTRASGLFGGFNFANPLVGGPGYFPKGSKIFFASNAAGEAHAVHCRTSGKIGSLTWNAIDGTVSSTDTRTAQELSAGVGLAQVDPLTPWPAIAKDARSGTATITNAGSSIQVSFPTGRATANYAVAVTPHADARVWVSGKSKSGFTLNRAGTGAALDVDWVLTPHVNP